MVSHPNVPKRFPSLAEVQYEETKRLLHHGPTVKLSTPSWQLIRDTWRCRRRELFVEFLPQL